MLRGTEVSKLTRMIQEHRYGCSPLSDAFTISQQPVFLSGNGVLPTFSTISNMLCAIPWWLSCLGGHRIRNLHFQLLQEGDTEVEAEDSL